MIWFWKFVIINCNFVLLWGGSNCHSRQEAPGRDVNFGKQDLPQLSCCFGSLVSVRSCLPSSSTTVATHGLDVCPDDVTILATICILLNVQLVEFTLQLLVALFVRSHVVRTLESSTPITFAIWISVHNFCIPVRPCNPPPYWQLKQEFKKPSIQQYNKFGICI